MTDYSDAPQSITELRANRSSDAADWTPRDVLINTLRDIDSGKVKPDFLIVGMKEGNSYGYAVSSTNPAITLGVLSRISYRVNARLDI